MVPSLKFGSLGQLVASLMMLSQYIPVRSLPSEPTAMWKRPVLGAVQSVTKTFFPAAPALAVPEIGLPFSNP